MSIGTLPAPPAPFPRAIRPKRHVPSWLVTSGLVVTIIVFLVAKIGPGAGLLFGFAILTPIELVFRRHRQPVRRPGLRTDMFHVLFTGGLTFLCAVVPIIFWAIVLYPFTLFGPHNAFQAQPLWLQGIESFVLFELMGYVAHRAAHEVPWIWKFHAVHHSSGKLDWIAGARLHPVEGFITASIIAPPLLVLGVRGTTLGAFTVFVQVWAVFLHANVNWRFKFLDGIWGTPEYHHWHHSNHPEARDKNYSGLLPVIDRLFGTYYQPKDRRPEVYGIDETMPDGWFAQMRHPFRRKRLHGVRVVV